MWATGQGMTGMTATGSRSCVSGPHTKSVGYEVGDEPITQSSNWGTPSI